MRKIVLISFFILLSIKNYAQFTAMSNDTLKPFGTGGYTLDGLCKTDSFYYVLGGYNNGAWNWNNFILKLDKQGHIVNKNIFDDTLYHHYPFAYNCLEINNNYLVFCEQVSNGIAKGMVTKVNRYSLDTLWTKVIAHPDTAIAIQPNSGQFSELTAIKATPDGGYILTGNYNKDCITGNLRSFLMKIDSMGNVEWRRVYNNIAYVFSIEIAPNGGYSFINKYGGTSLILTDSLGNILLNKAANNYTGRATSGDLKYTGNNNFIVSTPFMFNSDFSHPLFGVNIFKINILTQQILWDKKYILYDNFDCISLHQAMGVETQANGDIIVSGTASRYGHDAVILKLNSNGDSLWCKSYDFHPDPYDCQLNDLIVTDDGGFMGVGFWSDQSGPGWTAWMFKTDANGVLGFDASTTLSIPLISVYPNPATDYTNIKLGNNLSTEASIKVYNPLGKLVLQDKIAIGKQTYKLDLKAFEIGVYFFEVVGEDGVLGSGRFVRE